MTVQETKDALRQCLRTITMALWSVDVNFEQEDILALIHDHDNLSIKAAKYDELMINNGKPFSYRQEFLDACELNPDSNYAQRLLDMIGKDAFCEQIGADLLPT